MTLTYRYSIVVFNTQLAQSGRTTVVKVAVPREIKNHEYRVALTPAGVHELTAHGHDVFVEAGAGLGSAITDEEYLAAGAKVLATAEEVWAEGDLVLKVKEPIAAEYPLLRARPGAVHLPAPGRRRGADQGADGRRHHRDRVRDGPDRRTARCRCSRRCRRWPAGSRRRWARTR